eukprot:7659739-Alexandrium_andersonii.AAC.1
MCIHLERLDMDAIDEGHRTASCIWGVGRHLCKLKGALGSRGELRRDLSNSGRPRGTSNVLWGTLSSGKL